jgi:dTDP-4-dehydrorhamnose reductase
MRILLIGRYGQVGWELCRSLAPLGEVVVAERLHDSFAHVNRGATDAIQLDLTNTTSIAESIRSISPDVIVNAAAYTAVDKAESDRDIALIVNGVAPGVIAEEARRLGALLVHYSTDYVFDGTGSHARLETDATAPVNFYGESKLEGENRIRNSGCRHLIFRTSWVYAARGNNFVRTILRLAASREKLNVVGDQIGAPTSAELIADVTSHILYRVSAAGRLAEGDMLGTFHLTASGETSWYEFAQNIVTTFEDCGGSLALKPGAIESITTKEYPVPAIRPLNSRLATQKLRNRFACQLPHWRIGLKRVVQEIYEEAKK